MANKTKQADRDRRAKIEAMRKAEQAKERRKSMLFIIIAAVVGLGLVAAAAIPAYLDSRNDPANKDLATFGVSLASAGCSAVKTSKGTNNEADRKHVADGTTEEYATVPPSYGPHWAAPGLPGPRVLHQPRPPEMEQLVHNLEHGYTILWYDDTIKGAQLDQLKDSRSALAKTTPSGRPASSSVSAWDDAYGTFPSGKHLGMSHWGSQDSYTQVCGKVSGEAVQKFIEDHPASDAPEPNAA